MSNLYNNNGISTFSIVSTDALFIAGKRFKDYITEIQTELDFEAAEIELLKQFADRIDISGLTGTLILNDENRNQILKGLIEAIQSEQTTQNNNITALQNSVSSLQNSDTAQNTKLQYWNANGTIYNNTGNGGISGISSSVAVVISGSDNTMVQFGGTNGISGGSNNGVRLRAQDTSDFHINCGNASGTINIGMDTSGGYGTSKINIGGGESIIRIGNQQEPLSLTTGPKIYIGQKHDLVADSDTILAGNVQTDSAQFVDLTTTSLISWQNLLALWDVPFSISTMPYWMIWVVSSLIPNYVYSDVVKMKRNAVYEKYGEIDTSNRLDLESLNIFNTSLVNPLNNVFTAFTLAGGCSMSTMNGTHRLYSLSGGVELRCDGGIVNWITTEDTKDTNRVFVGNSEVSMTASKSSTNITIQALHSGTAIDFYNNNSINGYSSTKKLTMKMTDANDIIVRGTTSYNGHPFTVDSTGISNEKGIAVKGATASASTISTKNVASPSFTINEAYSGIVQNTLYRDANSNLYFNGKNISAPVASTANTYILTISGNSTTPPVSNGGLVSSYTSTTGYYIEKSAYSVNTEYEMATFKSSNIDLTTNPIIPDGVWDFNFYHSYNGNEIVNAYFKIYIEQTLIASPNTVTTTLLVDGSASPIPLTMNGTTGTYTILENQLFMPLYQFPDLVSYTYKIVVKQYFKQPTGNTNAHVVRFSYNNGSLSHLHSTLNTGGGITAIPTLQQVLTSGASANSIGITNLDSVSGSNNADVFYSATGSGQLSLNAAGSTKLRVGSSGITATSTLNMNDNNITGLNKILGTSSGSLIIRDSSDIGGLKIGGGRIGVNGEPHASYMIDCAGDINVQAGFNFRKGGAVIGESQIRNIGGGYLEWATNQYSWTLNSSNFLPTGGINCQAQKVFLTINLWNDSNSDNGNDDSYYFTFNGYTANSARYQSNMQLSFNGSNYVHNIASNYAFHVSRYAGNIITLKIEVEKLRPYYWGIVFRAYCGDVYIPGSTQFSNNWGDMMNNACFFYDGTDSNVFSSLRIYSNGNTQPFTNLNCAVHTLDRSTYYIAGGGI